VIAMADYWSQTVLKPLHERLMTFIKGIETDVTYNQAIAPFGNSNQHYYSFDLTAATDRIPIQLYEILLEHLFNKTYQEAWSSVMVKIPFDYNGQPVTYATGQPMGMYSSWPLMALVHHLIVRYSANLVEIPNFTDYRL
jgi:putative transposon-encoded protein